MANRRSFTRRALRSRTRRFNRTVRNTVRNLNRSQGRRRLIEDMRDSNTLPKRTTSNWGEPYNASLRALRNQNTVTKQLANSSDQIGVRTYNSDGSMNVEQIDRREYHNMNQDQTNKTSSVRNRQITNNRNQRLSRPSRTRNTNRSRIRRNRYRR